MKDMNHKLDKIINGEPSEDKEKIFGLPFDEHSASLIILPVPWDATTSYKSGTSKAPQQIIAASQQLDLEDLVFSRPYLNGFYMLPEDQEIVRWNQTCIDYVKKIRESKNINHNKKLIGEVNKISEQLNTKVEILAKKYLDQGKFVGLLGGEHSCPFGLIKALSQREKEFGILHIDAHFDLRNSYEGFEYSHASIMYNVLEKIPQVSKISHVGIRDFCFPERKYCEISKRTQVWYDHHLFQQKANGICFSAISEQIISSLPDKVYISFDIDGLEPSFCPSTGTPVPGGVSFHEACFLLEALGKSKKKVIGFDLCEVTPSKDGTEWDENVGSRILYKICGSLFHK